MKQLRLGDILNLVSELINEGMKLNEIKDLPVFIGDDEELNGIHNAYFVGKIEKKDKEEWECIQELIYDSTENIEKKGKMVLIS